MKSYFPILVFFVLAVSCAHEPSVLERMAKIPMPANAQAKVQECDWIMSELARLGKNGSKLGDKVVITSKAIYDYYEALNFRYNIIGCDALPIIQFIDNNKKSSTDDCVETCKKNTNRTSEECFDECEK